MVKCKVFRSGQLIFNKGTRAFYSGDKNLSKWEKNMNFDPCLMLYKKST